MEKELDEKKVEEVHLPLLGEPAPDFEADTTFGKLRLKDFSGKWLVLFSHPADFTPVCTTEFIANWRPGDEVVVPPPKTQEMAEKRMKEGYTCVDWYLCKKKL
ncbi:MAG: redoxin domain-containing protein [Methanophagales archaeon]|nr:redoxin domain-containing protein [Methanophagales archaeon]